jgi:hypothetical protein
MTETVPQYPQNDCAGCDRGEALDMEFKHSKDMAPGLELYPHEPSGVFCWKFIPTDVVSEWKRVGSQPRILR